MNLYTKEENDRLFCLFFPPPAPFYLPLALPRRGPVMGLPALPSSMAMLGWSWHLPERALAATELATLSFWGLGAEGRAQKQHRHKSHQRMMVSLSERLREDTAAAGEASSSLPMLRAAGHAWNRAMVQPTRVSCARQAMARCVDTILTE